MGAALDSEKMAVLGLDIAIRLCHLPPPVARGVCPRGWLRGGRCPWDHRSDVFWHQGARRQNANVPPSGHPIRALMWRPAGACRDSAGEAGSAKKLPAWRDFSLALVPGGGHNLRRFVRRRVSAVGHSGQVLAELRASFEEELRVERPSSRSLGLVRAGEAHIHG